MKKWSVQGLLPPKPNADDIIKTLLKNRGIKTKEEKEFLNPNLSKITPKSVGINLKEFEESKVRIKKAIKNKEQIVVFGDYDVDGICGSAIIWESLNQAGAKILPYIPHRIDEGYGLSVKGIENLLSKIPETKLIITVDNGIVAKPAVDFAKEKEIDVIITDHHVPSESMPKAYSIIHTTKLCGAGVGWMLAREFKDIEDHLSLAALASIADLVPLVGPSRTITKLGLLNLRESERLGLVELFRECRLVQKEIGVYEVGHIIAPRLNAMGRLESAMDSLRLLCTSNRGRAHELARKLGSTNLERQNLTEQAVFHAVAQVKSQTETGKLLFISHETYQQGVIGLVAGKLVEQYYLPSIVVSKGDIYSKASARSILGFNIIEFIRKASDLLVDAGGHPMAAGFTVETTKIELVQKKLQKLALKEVTKKLLTQTLKIDCELPTNLLNFDLYEKITQLEPFGMGNPNPVFTTKNLEIEDVKAVGQEGKHLKFKLRSKKELFDAIGFSMGKRIPELKIGTKVSIAYNLTMDSWNGNNKLQLKLKDIKMN